MSLMPRPPSGTAQVKITPVEQPETTALYNALKKIHDKPNTVTLLQFRKFEPLFRKDHKLSPEQIEELTELYRTTFDFYKETIIIRTADDPTVVLRLPALFTPVRTLSPTPHNDALVNINSKMAGQMPAYATTAFGRMADALIAEQAANRTVISSYRDSYVKTVHDFLAAYSNKGTPAAAAETNDASAVFQKATWDFEE